MILGAAGVLWRAGASESATDLVAVASHAVDWEGFDPNPS